jgi:hypothetical protein
VAEREWRKQNDGVRKEREGGGGRDGRENRLKNVDIIVEGERRSVV